MLPNQLSEAIHRELTFNPTAQQGELIEMLSQWCCNPIEHKTFILKGYAGTGKTSVVSALIAALQTHGIRTVQLAPTGRAAKVLSNTSQRSAYSIHKEIYRQKSISETQFNINYNAHHNTVFIVDEASMIANTVQENQIFGSGQLLDDLIEYVYSGDNCCIIFTGDTAQLPPVESNYSPALDPRKLESYGLETTEYTLTQVHRQSERSGILYNATKLRTSLTAEPFEFVKFETRFPDIFRVGGEDLIDQINSSYSRVGEENTIILTRSNKRALLYNQGVRNQVLQREDEISGGDYILITKNNYHWAKPYDNIDFIANGDIAEIVRVRNIHEAYGQRFADATLRLIDYEMEITARVNITSLYSEQNQTQKLAEQIAMQIADDNPQITTKRELWKTIREDQYYNALHIKFAYAITCHKAQGGAWEHVYIDQGYITPEQLNAEYAQWLYTAITRSKARVYFVNFSDYMFE